MARRIEIWPTERLVPYARNARTHSAEQVAYSERCRSPFRGDGDRDSELMPITIPR
jgi:hypothetical protein